MCLNELNENRHYRKYNDTQSNEGEVFLNEGNVTKEVTTAYEKSYPNDCADYIVTSKGSVVHFANAGNERCEGTHDGSEAGKNNCFMTVLFVKLVSFLDVFRLNNSAFGIYNCHTGFFANEVVGGVAQNCAD